MFNKFIDMGPQKLAVVELDLNILELFVRNRDWTHKFLNFYVGIVFLFDF
jgi:hypothetical protein